MCLHFIHPILTIAFHTGRSKHPQNILRVFSLKQMFLCRYALFRIIITISVIAMIIITVLPLRKKDCTAVMTTVPLVMILVIIYWSHCTYCTVIIIPFYHGIVYLEIYLFCNNNTNRGVNKITDMEKAHRLIFGFWYSKHSPVKAFLINFED